MAATDNVQLVGKKELAKLGKAIGALGVELGKLTEAFAEIAGEIEPKKKRVKRAAAAPAASSPAAQDEAPGQKLAATTAKAAQDATEKEAPAPQRFSTKPPKVTQPGNIKPLAGKMNTPKIPGAAAH